MVENIELINVAWCLLGSVDFNPFEKSELLVCCYQKLTTCECTLIVFCLIKPRILLGIGYQLLNGHIEVNFCPCNQIANRRNLITINFDALIF